ncbi:MAG: PD40 domain-containing protein, partial [Acidobacteria bacterium]|nr:PD40 domain-containing protein [Acidobacteriota bacterium]
LVWLRSGSKPASRSEWVQLTHFPDSVVQPALSPDGRMLTFIRGARAENPTPGQIYVKMLPDGEPKQLTRDDLPKMSPVFSPDGSRIAYTAVDTRNEWDSWQVSALGGEPRHWLPNASGLAWVGRQKLLFSEKIRNSQGNHMKIVAADESRAGARDLYVPMPAGAMAHRSFPSPDGNWALAAEMDDRGAWLPCRLIPMDGSSPSRPVGPPGACWFAAWSPDGTWMYVNSNVGDGFHIWRQRFSASGTLAPPEEITSGPTQEEGIAMASDGRSFITAVGLNQTSVWVHGPKGDRQVSLEGYAHQPKFIANGKRLLYQILKAGSPPRSELWIAEVDSGTNEPLLPGFPIAETALGVAYDISADGRQVVMQAVDREGKNRLWLAPLDRRSPPRQIPNVEGDGPLFAPNGEVLFRTREGGYGFAYRVRADGTGLRKASEHPVIETEGVSPDGKWLVVYARPNEEAAGGTLALPLDGGSPVQIYGTSLRAKWSPDGRLLFLLMHNATYVLPLPPGRMLPAMPAGGFRSEAEIASLPRVRVIDNPDVAPGPTPDVYAFSRETVQRNLYRIPVPRGGILE